MKTQVAFDHYGSRIKMAAAAKCSRQAVYKWGEYVPEVAAYYLSLDTDGALVYDEAGYRQRRRIRR
jgi:hypothetical protein